MSGNAGNIIVDEEISDSNSPEASESTDNASSSNDEPTQSESGEPEPLLDESETAVDVDDEPEEDDRTPAEIAAGDTDGDPTNASTSSKVTPQPFKYAADKAEHLLDGAQYYPGDGLYISEQSIPQLKRLLSAGTTHNGSWQKEKTALTRQIRELSEVRSDKEEQADHIARLFADLAQAEDENDVVDWAIEFHRNRANNELELKRRQLDRREAQIAKRFEPTPEEQEAALSESVEAEFTGSLEHIFNMPFARVLNSEDREYLREKLGARARTYLRRANRDIPEFGVKAGETFYDGASLLEDVRERAELIGRKAQASTATDAALAANRRKLGDSGNIPPSPAASPNRPATAAREASRGQPRDTNTGRFIDRAEYDDYMRSDMTYEKWREQHPRR